MGVVGLVVLLVLRFGSGAARRKHNATVAGTHGMVWYQEHIASIMILWCHAALTYLTVGQISPCTQWASDVSTMSNQCQNDIVC